MRTQYEPLGRILCKGSGLKVYLEIKLSRELPGQDEEIKLFRYKLGALKTISTSSDRQTSLNLVAGRKNALGFQQGIRQEYGEIVFEQINNGILYDLFKDVKGWERETNRLYSSSLDGFSLDDYDLTETDAAVISKASDHVDINLYQNEITKLADLPPVNIIVIGYADQIDPSTGAYETGNTYQFKLNGVQFVSETFSFAAGSPFGDVVTNVNILGGVETWKKIAQNTNTGEVSADWEKVDGMLNQMKEKGAGR